VERKKRLRVGRRLKPSVLGGKAVPERSLFYRKGLQVGVPSDVDSRLPDLWIDVERGRQAPGMSEQVYYRPTASP
jgi:hypothetical protein